MKRIPIPKKKEKYYYNKKTIIQLINGEGKYNTYELNCYLHNVEINIDKVLQKILFTLNLNTKSRKFIFS